MTLTYVPSNTHTYTPSDFTTSVSSDLISIFQNFVFELHPFYLFIYFAGGNHIESKILIHTTLIVLRIYAYIF